MIFMSGGILSIFDGWIIVPLYIINYDYPRLTTINHY